MGVICDYFSAPSDALAASVIGEGPTGRFPVVDAKGVDPEVLMGRLQAALKRRRFGRRKDTSELVELRDDGALVVVRMSEEWQAVLSSASDSAIAPAAASWASAEEFGGTVASEDLEALVRDLIALARDAGAGQQRVYCWICV